MRSCIRLISTMLWALCSYAIAEERVLKVYHDADYTNHYESARSMEMGFATALDEIQPQLDAYKIEWVRKDHRGSSVRSYQHMQQYLTDPDALVFLGGLHSSPYIRYRDFINQKGILLLIPWAAGGPITRYSEGTNWVFRLSIDDTKAGYRIAQYALDEAKCHSPHLLLEDTPWGKSNHNTLLKALKARQKKHLKTTWFNWHTKEQEAKILLRNIQSDGADCILYVGNALEGDVFSQAMLSLPESQHLPIISHWGITGGSFGKKFNNTAHQKLKLSFIQTCFSFVSSPANDFSKAVFKRAKNLFPEELQNMSDIPAPPGFIHSYDLARVVMTALKHSELTGDIVQDRGRLRSTLENIPEPVQGLIKIYDKPFQAWTESRDDAHEALGLNDFCMAYYDDKGHIIVQTKKTEME